MVQAFRTGSGSRVLVKMAASATRTGDVYVTLATVGPGVNIKCITCSRSLQVNYHHHRRRHHHHHHYHQ